MFGASLISTVLVALIFLFVIREAGPALLGELRSSNLIKALPPEQAARLEPEALRTYLGLSPDEFAAMPPATIQYLIEARAEQAGAKPDTPDAAVNTASWRNILMPRQWADSNRAEYRWEPVSSVPKYNIVPLLIGSLKITAIAILFAAPLAICAAVHVSQIAQRWTREWLKPSVELLAGVPSVVMGFFALVIMATFLQAVFGFPVRLNSFVAGIALGLAIIPLIFSVAEDALSSVPESYALGALALGASRWQTAWRIVLPAALPGVYAAIVLGFGRAIGETMIVYMASGNSPVMSWDIFDSARTVTATIAEEPRSSTGSARYPILFLLGAMLFCVTFITNFIGALVVERLKRRFETGAERFA